MRRTPFFKVAFRSFFSRSLYRDIGMNWRWMSFFHLAAVLFVCWVPILVPLWVEMYGDSQSVIDQIPRITYKDGVVSAEVEQPYVIYSSDGEELCIIDTTGEVASLDDRTAMLLLTESKLIGRERSYETRIFDFGRQAAPGEFSVDRDRLAVWFNVWGVFMVLFLHSFIFLFSLIYRTVLGLWYSLIGVLIARLAGVSISYAGVLSIAFIAMTPAILLKAIFWSLEIHIPRPWFLYFAVAMSYLAFALFSLKANDSGLPTEA